MKITQEMHDKAVQQIAEIMFSFPGSEFTPGLFHPSWKTFTNVPKRTMPVPHHWMDDLYPDIVIADIERCNIPRIIAEVATEEELSLEAGIQPKWKPDMDECSVLYIFIPEGTARKTAKMILDYKVFLPTALYTYGFNDDGMVRVTPM